MSTTVRKVITDSIQARGLDSYLSHAEPVIADVEAAAENLVASLTSVAVAQGLTEAQAEAILVQVGLVQEPAPEPTATVSGEEEDGDLAAQVASLTQVVDGLVRLAERHLGSRI